MAQSCVNLALWVAAGDDQAAGAAQAFLMDRVLGGREGWQFNDDPSTSYEDVVLALKRAHELSEAAA